MINKSNITCKYCSNQMYIVVKPWPEFDSFHMFSPNYSVHYGCNYCGARSSVEVETENDRLTKADPKAETQRRLVARARKNKW